MTSGAFPNTPGFLEGQITAVGAVRDVHLVIDGPGCNVEKLKRVAVHHDLCSTLIPAAGHCRVHVTNLLDADMVFGTEEAVERTVSRVVRHEGAGLVLLSQHSIPVLTGTDAISLATMLTERHGVRVLATPSDPIDGEFQGGYASVLETLARALPAGSAVGKREGLALVGYFFGRNEMDHRADLAELETIAAALALPVCSCWLGGGSLDELQAIGRADTIIGLPHGGEAPRILAERLGVPWISCALPVGVTGTVRWIRRVARSCDRDDRAEAYIRAATPEVYRRLEWVIPHVFAGRHAALVADPFLAPGLVDYLIELGFELTYVGLHTRDPGRAEPVAAQLAAASQPARVEVDPRRPDLLERFAELQRHERLDLVLGSGNERGCSLRLGLPHLELGYPCPSRHALFDAPLLGFAGALWIADALCNLLLRDKEIHHK